MNIQFKSIIELREMLDNKSISIRELTQESFLLAKSMNELNCFVTMNEEVGQKKANAAELIIKTLDAFWNSFSSKRFILYRKLENNMLFKNPI